MDTENWQALCSAVIERAVLDYRQTRMYDTYEAVSGKDRYSNNTLKPVTVKSLKTFFYSDIFTLYSDVDGAGFYDALKRKTDWECARILTYCRDRPLTSRPTAARELGVSLARVDTLSKHIRAKHVKIWGVVYFNADAFSKIKRLHERIAGGVTVKEFAAKCGENEYWVRSGINRGKIEAVKLGGVWRVTDDAERVMRMERK